MSIKAGDVLGGKYEVERVIGEGGMGLVVAARHLELGHRVAIKCLHTSALGHEGAVARFEREARAAAALTNDHVARVIDVGRFENGSPYMVMEFLEGEDLLSQLRREGALSIADTIRYACHASDGLAEAHAAGIIHRDVKPSNLFATRRKKGGAVVKVLDFGIAKTVEAGADRGLTATQALLGSPQYMSPEQVRESKTLDARTDIWALGVTMYECLTGKKPFDAPSMVDLCFAIVQEDPPSIVAQRQDVPPRLEAVIFKCLAKNPDQRYATMADLHAELTMMLSHLSGDGDAAVLSRVPGIPISGDPNALSATIAADGVSTGDSVSRTQVSLTPPKLPGKNNAFVFGALLVALVGAAAVFFRDRDGLPPPASVAAPSASVPPASATTPKVEEPKAPPAAEAPSSPAPTVDASAAAQAAPIAAPSPAKAAGSKTPAHAKSDRPAPDAPRPVTKGKGLDMNIE